MEGDQEQNNPDNLDLTLRIEVGDSRTAPENPQIEEKFEPGFAMMAGEHNNPWANIALSNSFGVADDETSENVMTMQDFLQMLMSPLYYGNMNELLNAEVEEEDQVNEEMSAQPEDLNLPANNSGDMSGINDGDVSGNNDDMDYYADGEMVSDDGMQEIQHDVGQMAHEALLEIEENAKVGLDQDTVDDRLMQDTYQPNETPQSLCIICMDEFKEGDSFGVLECGHNYFHPGCITTWLMEKNECPLCKSVALSAA